ncbi:hypothetical protein DAQ1742_03010 [Dickeya aquatica]|uniref:Uncharacterized protein n=1 Tax=Dickeya aquatica TaxID=1401087 RepID=A0A375AD56_9GAMM|nr:hypothetical protein DAQ1742_03010 [Dickeya aquatica]
MTPEKSRTTSRWLQGLPIQVHKNKKGEQHSEGITVWSKTTLNK